MLIDEWYKLKDEKIVLPQGMWPDAIVEAINVYFPYTPKRIFINTDTGEITKE